MGRLLKFAQGRRLKTEESVYEFADTWTLPRILNRIKFDSTTYVFGAIHKVRLHSGASDFIDKL